jgi:signal transduction histidine kinase
VDRLFDLSLAQRRYWCLAWQVPLLVLTLGLDAALLVADPDLLRTPGILAGSAAIALLSIVAYRVPERWLIAIPLLDILAVAALRSETADRIAGTNTSALIPIACLGFCFGARGVAAATVGGTVVAASWHLRVGQLPVSGTEWVSLLALPALSLALGLIGLASARAVGRQRAENAALLRRVRHELEIRRAVLDNVDVGVAFFRADGTLDFANGPGRDLARRSGADITGPSYEATSVWRADGERPLPYDEQPLVLALAGEEFPPELLWLGPAEERTAALVSARQVRSYDGAGLGVVVVANDVTELVEALRVREEFLATLSHELRTPLNGMVGLLDLLAEDLGADETHGGTVRTARASALRLTERIDHLLTASSVGRLVLETAEVPVADLVRFELDRQAPDAEARGVHVEARLAPVVAVLDARLFGLVVANLVSNALKHTPTGGVSRVELRALPEGVELRVSDTGPGMHGHERERAFDPFYRAASERRGAVPGIGLGLTIVRGIVEAHGGEVALSTEHAIGTTVVVRLPARPTAAG